MSYPGVETETPEITAEIQDAVSAAVKGMSPDVKYALTGWGKDVMNKEWDVKCPSGQWCKVRKVRFEDLIALGIADNLDVFTSMLMAQAEAQGAQSAGGNELKILETFADPEKKARFMGSLNRIANAGVVAPKVVLVDDGNLPEGTVFAGDIEFQDKMFLFGILFRGRVDELSSFREEQGADMGDMAESPVVPEASE